MWYSQEDDLIPSYFSKMLAAFTMYISMIAPEPHHMAVQASIFTLCYSYISLKLIEKSPLALIVGFVAAFSVFAFWYI